MLKAENASLWLTPSTPRRDPNFNNSMDSQNCGILDDMCSRSGWIKWIYVPIALTYFHRKEWLVFFCATMPDPDPNTFQTLKMCKLPLQHS